MESEPVCILKFTNSDTGETEILATFDSYEGAIIASDALSDAVNDMGWVVYDGLDIFPEEEIHIEWIHPLDQKFRIEKVETPPPGWRL
jgi:hypothetical protein